MHARDCYLYVKSVSKVQEATKLIHKGWPCCIKTATCHNFACPNLEETVDSEVCSSIMSAAAFSHAPVVCEVFCCWRIGIVGQDPVMALGLSGLCIGMRQQRAELKEVG